MRSSQAPLALATELCPGAAHTGDPLEHVPKESRHSAVTGRWSSLPPGEERERGWWSVTVLVILDTQKHPGVRGAFSG